MAVFEWNQSYSVKVTQLDQQHQTLFRTISELQEALRVGHGKEVVGKVLQKLIDYTKSHFSAEEAILEKNGYPELTAHKALHRALVKKVLEFQKEFESGSSFLAIEVMQFLQKWLTEHIQDTDQKYGQFLNEKGVH